MKLRGEFITILHEETALMEIVKLIGSDVLPDEQKLIIEIARVIRVGFLQQNAYHSDDTYVPLLKQYKMMEVILRLYNKGKMMISKGAPISKLIDTGLFESLVKIKYDVPNNKLEMLDEYLTRIDEAVETLI